MSESGEVIESGVSRARPGVTVPAVPIVVRAGGAPQPRSDLLATEEPLEIRAQHRGAEHPVAVTMRTPGHDFDLAVGYLHGEGMVRVREHVQRVSYCASGPPEQIYNLVTVELSDDAPFDPAPLARHSAVTAACGVCGKASIDAVRVAGIPALGAGPVLDAVTLLRLPDAMRAAQRIFDRTGGVHAAGLFDTVGRALIVREDVGRHNAVDKVVGSLLLTGKLPAGECVLQVSGRASFEIVQKAALAGIPVLSAVSAPSSLAVDLAVEAGMTLVAFVRDQSFSVYAGASRIAETRSTS